MFSVRVLGAGELPGLFKVGAQERRQASQFFLFNQFDMGIGLLVSLCWGLRQSPLLLTVPPPALHWVGPMQATIHAWSMSVMVLACWLDISYRAV